MELEQLRDNFAHRDKRSRIPMVSVAFALASARRESEICRLEWRDNEERTRTGIVRDAKHPTAKEGNHRRFKYTPEAWAIVQAQAHSSIFPYEPRSIGAAFTRACHVLGIKDLRFHDLRHEATSRLFERGYQIHEVAQFTLHDSGTSLSLFNGAFRGEGAREARLRRTCALVNHAAFDEDALPAIPTPEHYLPLLIFLARVCRPWGSVSRRRA